MISLRDQLQQIPLAVRFFELASGIVVSGHVIPRTFADTVDFEGATRRACNAHAVQAGQCAAVRHPKVSGSAFDDLKLDGGRPNFLRALYVVENSAVARLARAWRVRALAPLELRAQIIVGEFLFGDDVAELLPGDMDNSVLDTKHMIGVIVQAVLFQKGVEISEIAPIEQSDCRAVGRNLAAGGERARRQSQRREQPKIVMNWNSHAGKIPCLERAM